MQKTHEFLEKNPEWLKEFIARSKEEYKKERLSMTEEDKEMERRCFYDTLLVVDTPEAAANLNAAFWEAEKRGPLNLDHIDFEKELEEGREYLRNNPDCLDKMVEAVRERARQNGDDLNPEGED